MTPYDRLAIKGEVETLARDHTLEAIETLVDLMRNGAPDTVRAAAANALLNRGWGLPGQAIDGSLSISPSLPKPVSQMSLAETEAEIALIKERIERRRLAEIEGTAETEAE